MASKNSKGWLDGYKTYQPEVEGYGSAREWRGAFYERMGFEQAERVKAEAQSRGKWRNEYTIISDMAGSVVSEHSMWSEIKTAFRTAAMNCHPDRASYHKKSKEEAEASFKEVSAAFAILARKYGQ